jgi:hypothetical protein
MINYADKMEQEARLKGNLAEWMEKHGNVLSDRQRSNAYTGVRILEVRWRGSDWRIVEVDGMTCQIERM